MSHLNSFFIGTVGIKSCSRSSLDYNLGIKYSLREIMKFLFLILSSQILTVYSYVVNGCFLRKLTIIKTVKRAPSWINKAIVSLADGISKNNLEGNTNACQSIECFEAQLLASM